MICSRAPAPGRGMYSLFTSLRLAASSISWGLQIKTKNIHLHLQNQSLALLSSSRQLQSLTCKTSDLVGCVTQPQHLWLPTCSYVFFIKSWWMINSLPRPEQWQKRPIEIALVLSPNRGLVTEHSWALTTYLFSQCEWNSLFNDTGCVYFSYFSS